MAGNNSPHACIDCQEAATVVCEACDNVMFCEKCVALTHPRSSKVLSSHARVSLAEHLRKQELHTMSVCRRHKKPMLLYCNVCQALICDTCIFTIEHKAHQDKIEVVGDAAGRVRAAQSASLKEVEEATQMICGVKERVTSARHVLEENAKARAIEIQEQIDQLQQLLQERKTALESAVRSVREEKANRLDAQGVQLSGALSKLEQTQRDLAKMEALSDLEVLSAKIGSGATLAVQEARAMLKGLEVTSPNIDLHMPKDSALLQRLESYGGVIHMAAPQNFAADRPADVHRTKLSWSPVEGAHAYEVKLEECLAGDDRAARAMAQDGNGQLAIWSFGEADGQSSAADVHVLVGYRGKECATLLTELKAGQQYVARVRALGAGASALVGLWSRAAIVMGGSYGAAGTLASASLGSASSVSGLHAVDVGHAGGGAAAAASSIHGGNAGGGGISGGGTPSKSGTLRRSASQEGIGLDFKVESAANAFQSISTGITRWPRNPLQLVGHAKAPYITLRSSTQGIHIAPYTPAVGYIEAKVIRSVANGHVSLAVARGDAVVASHEWWGKAKHSCCWQSGGVFSRLEGIKTIELPGELTFPVGSVIGLMVDCRKEPLLRLFVNHRQIYAIFIAREGHGATWYPAFFVADGELLITDSPALPDTPDV